MPTGLKMAYFKQKHFISKEEFTDLYWNQGLSLLQIAKRLNCRDVQYWFNKYRIPRRSPEETRRKISLTKKGCTPWNKGKHDYLSVEASAKLSEQRRGRKNPHLAQWNFEHNPLRRGIPRPDLIGKGNPMFGRERLDLAEFNKRRTQLGYKHPMLGKHHSEEAKLKNRLAHKGKKLSPEHKAKIAKANKLRTPEVLLKVIKGLKLRPNRPERQLIEIFTKHNLPFRYVGDGQLIISGLLPDFVNVNGKKEIIELFGEYWHKTATKPTRTEHGRGAIFKQFGYRTLVIWAKELENEDKVVQKIRAFTEVSNGCSNISE